MDQVAAALGDRGPDGSGPSPVASRVAAAVGALRAYAGRPAAALEALAAHAAAPLAHDDHLADHVLAVARAVTGSCELAVVDARRGLERCTAVTGLVPGPDPEIHVLSSTLALGEAGRLDEAAALAEEWYGRAARRGLHVGWLALARARVALAAGDLAVASRYGREALADFADLDNHAPRRWALAALALAASSAGDGPGAAGFLDQLDGLGPSAVRFLEPDVDRARAWGVAATGNVSQARDRLRQAAVEAEAAGLTTLALVAHHDALRLGSRSGAEGVVRLRSTVDGALAAARGRHAEAFLAGDAAGLLAAADELSALGAHLLAADAAAQAVVRLRRATGAARLRDAVAQCHAHRSRCGPAATPALREVGLARLSGREHEVARLAASGTSSKAIALQLGISVRTVDNLLQRAYTKLGVHSRAGLGVALDRAVM
jgi:DNA-binding CsgD family transcriptional regulator